VSQDEFDSNQQQQQLTLRHDDDDDNRHSDDSSMTHCDAAVQVDDVTRQSSSSQARL